MPPNPLPAKLPELLMLPLPAVASTGWPPPAAAAAPSPVLGPTGPDSTLAAGRPGAEGLGGAALPRGPEDGGRWSLRGPTSRLPSPPPLLLLPDVGRPAELWGVSVPAACELLAAAAERHDGRPAGAAAAASPLPWDAIAAAEAGRMGAPVGPEPALLRPLAGSVSQLMRCVDPLTGPRLPAVSVLPISPMRPGLSMCR
jgi:hypothetical protein